jgi:putative ubiquitin-RnfH superfamily antitoxin RatB of RatAB toxin-antitoxin module
MPESDMIEVEVVYALPEEQYRVRITVPAGTAVRDALRSTALGEGFAELDLAACPIGIFGKEVAADYRLKEGDRIEIYRPLSIDPRAARRKLAAEGVTMGVKRRS